MTASLPHDQTLSFQRVSKQNPRRFPAGGFCQVVRPSSEVALSAEQHGDAVLVLQLINGCRLGKRGSRVDIDSTRVLLVQLRPVDVGGEGEVLDRGPDDVATDHRDGRAYGKPTPEDLAEPMRTFPRYNLNTSEVQLGGNRSRPDR